MKYTYSSDSENESSLGKDVFSINSGVQGAISPLKKKERNKERKTQIVTTKRNSFKIAVSDSEDSSDTGEESGKKVLNFRSGSVSFKALD